MVILLVSLILLVNYTPVQNFIAQKGADYLSKKLKTKVTIQHIRIDFLNHLEIKGLLIEDLSHDTLLYAGEAQVRTSDWFIFRDKPVFHYLALHNSYAHLYRTASSKEWNYSFIEDAFGTNEKSKSSGKGKPIEFDLEKIELDNMRFHFDDKWIGEDIDLDLGSFLMNANDVNFDKKIIDLSEITINKAVVSVNEYKGGRPKHMRPKRVNVVDTTPFNTDNWAINIKDATLNDCAFRLKMDDDVPAPNLFDENHLNVTNINAVTNGIIIRGDTINGNVDLLTATERCGIAIKKMRSKVSVSPIASICSDLYLETNYSKLQNHYAMYYRRFPDFTSYIDSVTMVARLKDAQVDKRDIEFFAPELKSFPPVSLHVSGSGKGTVANLAAQHLVVSDGNTVIKGDVSMKGLPDIYTTQIAFTDAELLTNGKGILRYVPQLRNSPDVSLESISYAYFRGMYKGLIEDFAVTGTLTTNLGNITTDIKMKIPGFDGNTAVYSGTLGTEDVQLGKFLRQPLLGAITLQEKISGRSFHPDHIQLDIDGNIKALGFKGYTYHNISTKGTLAKKQFDGNLLVDDPNLALIFDGGINYSDKNIKINATAHLMGCDLHALQLVADTITASADFDLNCTGSNIDNFSGYAKLYNIDLKRNRHRLAIDSVYVNSTGEGANRSLTVQSNDIVANVTGNYQLSKLPISAQYYLSRYIPNYIKAPDTTAPDQDFTFTIRTITIDSLLGVTVPIMRGFDSSLISGSLNTTAKKLTLNANVPYGSIGNVHMSKIAVHGEGDLNAIALSTTVNNVSIGDSFLNGSLSVTATVGNDSVAFAIATTTPDISSAITLNGQVIARRDSLFLTILPSQFYMNDVKWNIAGGSKIEYSDKYLNVQGVSLSSGLQKISASSELQNNDKSLVITTENLDIGQLGSWAGLAAYQPDGRINGTIRIDKIFKELYIAANIKATGVLLGTDTIGTVNIIGSYDGTKKLASLDPQTGIYRDNASIVLSGNVSLDSNTHQKLNGTLQFNDAPVAWASPFLTGLMSNLSGTLNGSVGFDGTSTDPILEGTVALKNAKLRLDYLGCNYSIPSAKVQINNKRIELGSVQIFDDYKNFATLTGYFRHNLFKSMRMRLNVTSDKIEVLNLTSNDNDLFYGNVIASMDSFTIRGPFNDIRLNMYNAAPAAKSRIYIPISSDASASAYNYITFKTYGKEQGPAVRKNKDKISISIDANMNQLAEMHIVMDPAAGDEIMGKGDGRVLLDIPSSNDIRMTGLYRIASGTYTYTFKELFIRQFKLEAGSTISFNGPFSETTLDVDAIYPVKAKLADLLNESEKMSLQETERKETQTPQWVDILLHMNGSLYNPVLTFDLDLEDKHLQSTVAYRKLTLMNYDDRQKTEQVGSLLLIGSFIPPDGIGGTAVASGAINNLSQVISSSASTGLTKAINKITGNKQLNVDVRYTNYNYTDQGFGANRNQVKGGVNKNYFNDRLTVEVGSTVDWGKPASTSTTSAFNLTGDFRVQYLISPSSGLRLNCFRTSDYDVTLDKDIQRGGVGISWRKSFDNIGDFFKSNRAIQIEKERELQKMRDTEQRDTTGKRIINKGTQ